MTEKNSSSLANKSIDPKMTQMEKSVQKDFKSGPPTVKHVGDTGT